MLAVVLGLKSNGCAMYHSRTVLESCTDERNVMKCDSKSVLSTTNPSDAERTP